MVSVEIDFSEDIEELRQVDGAWPTVYAGPTYTGLSPISGQYWINTDSSKSYVYDGVQWIEILISEV